MAIIKYLKFSSYEETAVVLVWSLCEDGSFFIRAEVQTPDNGHFRPKHVVKDL
jgi:hypothetical protein